MTTTLRKIVNKVLPASDAEENARKQIEQIQATLKVDRAEADALAKDVGGWEKELGAIRNKGWDVSVSDGDAAQALLGKIDVASIRLQALGTAQAGNQSQIDALVSRFPRLRTLIAQ